MSEPESLDSLIEKSKHGGKRPGAGRRVGAKNKATLEKLAQKKLLEQRVMANLDRLINAQLDLALGEKFLMVKRVSGSGKDRKTWVEVVTDTDTIKDYLDDDGETINSESGEDYYYMSTRPANNQALQGLMDRTFGKAAQSVDLTTNGNDLGATLSADQAEQLIRARAERSDT
jgi:hypothetical protein